MKARPIPTGTAPTIDPHGIAGTPVTITAKPLDYPWINLNTDLDTDEAFIHDVFAAIRATLPGWQPGSGMSVDVPTNNIAGFADLATAVAVLRLTGDITPHDPAAPVTFLGRVSGDGGIGSTIGVRAAVSAAINAGHTTVVVPSHNRAEAEAVPGTRIIAAANLREVIAYLNDGTTPDHYRSPGIGLIIPSENKDMADLPVDHRLRRVLEVAATGAHSISETRATDTTDTAAWLAGILPMSARQHDEASRVQSVTGLLAAFGGAGIENPPVGRITNDSTFEQVFGQFPAGLVLPGQVSVAHGGVLSITGDTPHLSHVVDVLHRGEILWRHRYRVHRLPAAPQCVVIEGSSVLSPRIAIRQVLTTIPAGPYDGGDSSAVVAARVKAARHIALDRWGSPNGHVSRSTLRSRAWRLPPAVTAVVDAFVETGHLSVRSHSHVLRMAWTLADLDGATTPTALHIDEALYLRGLAGGEA